jgi:hypothetical protein
MQKRGQFRNPLRILRFINRLAQHGTPDKDTMRKPNQAVRPRRKRVRWTSVVGRSVEKMLDEENWHPMAKVKQSANYQLPKSADHIKKVSLPCLTMIDVDKQYLTWAERVRRCAYARGLHFRSQWKPLHYSQVSRHDQGLCPGCVQELCKWPYTLYQESIFQPPSSSCSSTSLDNTDRENLGIRVPADILEEVSQQV